MAQDPVAIARELIRCPSVTPADAGALGVLERVLEATGFTVQRIAFSEPGMPDIENLYARIGTGRPHLVFAGHTDVVPPGDAAMWTHPPFAGAVINETLYGRGAEDMKGAIACFAAAALAYLNANGGMPKGSMSFLVTGDEEGPAVNGTVKLLRWAREHGEAFDHCILGEPTNVAAVGDTIKIGRRGSLNGTLVVTGRQGHVAYPGRADNPIRGIVTLMQALMAEPLDAGSAHFEPSNLEFTSVDVGNQAVNVIPAEARTRFNVRYNDRHTQDSLKASLEQRCARAAAERISWRLEFDPSNADVFLIEPGPFVDLVSAAVAEATGRTPQLSTSGGTSDARFIQNYCPVLEFGLVGRTMHQVDERVPLADLAALTAVYRRILDRYFADTARINNRR
jgi:succinyl-diaminopimelate desuccinylase